MKQPYYPDSSLRRLKDTLKETDDRHAVQAYFQKHALGFTFAIVAGLAVAGGTGYMIGVQQERALVNQNQSFNPIP